MEGLKKFPMSRVAISTEKLAATAIVFGQKDAAWPKDKLGPTSIGAATERKPKDNFL